MLNADGHRPALEAALAEVDAEPLPLDPLVHPGLPKGARALYAGGRYPDVCVEAGGASGGRR